MIAKTVSSAVRRLSLEERRRLQQRMIDFRLKRAVESGSLDIPRLPRATGANVFPASYAQEQAWLLHEANPQSGSHNISFAIRFSGTIYLPALLGSLNEIIRRHEILRTSFEMRDGQLKQIVQPELVLNPELTALDALDLGEADRETELRKRLESQARAPFDLSRLPLLRVSIFRLHPENHVVLFTLHHIIWDGWSIGVFIKEFAACYEAGGRRDCLPELQVQYADYASWQRDWLDQEMLDKQLAFWLQSLNGKLPVLEMPLDRPRPKIQSHVGALYHFQLNAGLAAGIRALCQENQATVFMGLLAAFNALLFRYTGQQDLLVATNLANRHCAEVEQLIGYFVNQILLRTKIKGTETFEQLLKSVRENTAEAYAHQDIPLDKVVSRLDFDRSPGRPGLFQVMFVLQNTPGTSLDLGELKLSSVPIDQRTSNLDMHFSLAETEAGINCAIEYNTDIFDAKTIRDFGARFEQLLSGVVRNPRLPISEYPLADATERQSLAGGLVSEKTTEPTAGSVVELLEKITRLFPATSAVQFRGEQLTYAELDQKSRRLALRLRALGVGPEVPVGIYLDRSLEWVIATVAVLRAGGAFVPLDPHYPKDRLGYMVSDSAISLLITHSELLDSIPQHYGQNILVDEAIDEDGAPLAESAAGLELPNARNLAYIIFTSGSSGKPKAVLLKHEGLVNVAAEQARLFQISPGTRVLQFASASFDASVFEMIMALTAGATLCLGTREQLLPGVELIRFLKEQRIEVVTLPPSCLALLEPDGLGDLKLVTVAGEACAEKLAAKWGASRRFFNLYGPTETTIWATACEWNAHKPLSIGQPINGTQVFLLDAAMQPVPPGITGEIYIGGVGLARGYANLPEFTAEKFVPHLFSKIPGARLYRTGDIGRLGRNGDLEFVGRADQQVKIRGFRVELEEVEFVIKTFPAVRDAVVVAHRGSDGAYILVGYMVVEEGTGTSGSEVREYLKTQLPDYMIPSAFILMPQFPTTPNGKVNRQAMPPCDESLFEVEKAIVQPRNPTEEKLVEIWKRMLKVETVGVTDDFFKLGGYSLLAVQIITEVYESFKIEIPVRFIFTMQLTVEDIARYISEQQMTTVPENQLPEIIKELDGLTDEEARRLLNQGSEKPTS
jgi:amino acid adenylation domain-containing protein